MWCIILSYEVMVRCALVSYFFVSKIPKEKVPLHSQESLPHYHTRCYSSIFCTNVCNIWSPIFFVVNTWVAGTITILVVILIIVFTTKRLMEFLSQLVCLSRVTGSSFITTLWHLHLLYTAISDISDGNYCLIPAVIQGQSVAIFLSKHR